ncbi:MAG: phospholipid transport system substrate-binding protein [Halioglobus sp.]|jgi:phospholipid transport system substrate-binding protein
MLGVVRLRRRFVLLSGFCLACFTVFSPLSYAAAIPAPSAYELVASVTERIMAIVDDAKAYVDEDPDRYYSEIDEALAPVIDYRGFARSVMGLYASGDRYRSLDEPGKAQLRAQLERFTTVIRNGLVSSYSKGLMAFSGSRIELTPPDPKDTESTYVSVQQLIYSKNTQPYVLLYQMGFNKKSQQWELRNLIIDGVNLGEIYKSQFQAAARKEGGDLDAVIGNWTTDDVGS